MLYVGFLVLATIFLLMFLLSMVWPPDSPWSPWWRTNGKIARSIIKTAKISKHDFIYDLGCGDGVLLVTAAQKVGAQGIGVEIDPARVLIARLRILLHGLNQNIHIKRGDLFKEDISQASVIVVYLVPKTLKRLEEKFRKELKIGTRIVSYVYPIEYFPEIARDQKNQVFVYEVSYRNKSSNGKKR